MKGIGDFFTYALIAVFTQNIVFTGASPMAILGDTVRKKGGTVRLALLVSLFSLLSALSVLPFDYIAPLWSSPVLMRSILLSAAAIIWYLIISAICAHAERLNSLCDLLPIAALNGTVLSMPLMMDINSISDPSGVIALAIGSGASFALAVWLIRCGLSRAESPDMPESFRGTPIMVVYIGLLALAFSAFGGSMDIFPQSL